MTQRDRYVVEIKRLESALKKTESKYLKADYSKAIRRMKSELMRYDQFQKGGKRWQRQEA